MSSTKTIAAASAIAGAFALLASATMPASAQQPPQGWFKVCSKQEDNDICNTQNIVTADSGQLLTAVNLIEIKGKINRKIFQVTVPIGRLIPPVSVSRSTTINRSSSNTASASQIAASLKLR